MANSVFVTPFVVSLSNHSTLRLFDKLTAQGERIVIILRCISYSCCL